MPSIRRRKRCRSPRATSSDYHFDDRITLIKSDLFAALTNKRYDLILCNPPYVTDAAMARLPKEYAHEPKVALAGGPDGMRLVKTIVRQARGYMKRGGVLIVEVGDGRAAAEKAFGDLSLTWLTTSAGDDMVFLAHQEQLAVGSRLLRSHVHRLSRRSARGARTLYSAMFR